MSENITEQPTSGINVVPDQAAQNDAENLQKQQDLRKLEDEIRMLRQVLNDKVKQSRQMRMDLGLATPLDNIDSMAKNLEDGINKVAEDVTQTDAYKKTSETLVGFGQVAGEGLSVAGAAIGAKFSQIQQSDSFSKLSANASTFGTNLLDTVTSIGKPKMQQEFNEGAN